MAIILSARHPKRHRLLRDGDSTEGEHDAGPAAMTTANRPHRCTVEPAWVLVVVDDQDDDCMVAFRLLEREGHHATVVESGQAAIELLEAEPYDLVLLDLTLPDGYEVLGALKSHQDLRHVPVIATGPVEEPGVVARCIELGAEDYLPKPFQPVLVRAKVDASLSKKRLREDLAEHLDAVSHMAEAASALAGDGFDASRLDRFARRPDPVGRLARAVLQMAANARRDPARSREGRG